MPTRQDIVTRRRLALSLLLAATLLLGACVYRVDVQQGNLLEDSDVDAVQVGMTRSQVRFLLGTPIIADTFHQERWDYIYYFRQGRQRKAERHWMIVYFDGDKVSRILKDVPVEPS
ncbi:MAG: outer membrane protein assembly factor BamE [Gammaproteobacteria bacterium]|nr:outer membrane protein assembly factor BamE [Gammaproteobacteria bacterium]